MADVNKLVFSMIRFLQDQKTNSSLDDEKVESIEVAIQCLESAYEIDTSDEYTVSRYQVQRNLLDIFNTQLGIEEDADFSSLSLHEATPEEKEEAESMKNKGNDFMKVEQFSEALKCYSDALKLDNKNSVYYCNRAAAYSKLSEHMLAIEDCQKALMIDPLYSKAYGRMGIAYTALEDHESAIECYRKALELDPGNQSYQNNLEISEQKLQEMAARSGLNMGPMGGMPDISSLLNNPAMMSMAQNLMTNPEMQNMMANIMSGASQGGEGGISSLLQVGQQLAQQMQQQNPELVQQLRSQMGRPPNDQNPSNQQPPKPDEGNKDSQQ